MGCVYADLKLTNASDAGLRSVTVRALCNSGAIRTSLPAGVANQLKLQTIEKRQVTTSDGTVHNVDYVGPLRIEFDNRMCFSGAFVLGDEPLPGAIEMQAMDVVLNLHKEQLTVNPESPNIASGKVKRSAHFAWEREPPYVGSYGRFRKVGRSPHFA